MTLKKVKIINIFLLFSISFLLHFIYNFIPSNITAVFFPVNESIWEHMKIIFYAFIIVSFIQNTICKKFKIEINNKYFETIFKSLLGIILYLTIFIPIYLLIGENLIFSISLMLIVYILMEIIGFKILKSKNYNLKIISILVTIICMISFGILTFFPPHNFVFRDEKSNSYGIYKN